MPQLTESQLTDRLYALFMMGVILASTALSSPPTLIAQTAPPANTATLNGFVRDVATKETLVGATVSVKGLKIGSFTNKSGFFSLKGIPAGSQTIAVAYLGYAKKEIQFDFEPNESKKITVELESKTSKTGEVTVTAEREADKRQISISQVNLQLAQVKQIRVGGESDVFRTIQYLPGVLAASQVSSGLFIRGGSPDQNLVLLDGMTVYNPSHLFGFISTFNTDAIKDVELSRGGFGAEYGGRLSAVLSITQKEGNREKFEGDAALGIISSKVALQGPLGEGSWFVSARRTYFDLIAALLPQDPLNPIPSFGFYDINAKVTQNLSPDDKVSLSGFLSSDFVGFNAAGLNANLGVGNRGGSLRWTHVFGDNLFSTVNLSASNYLNNFSADLGGINFGVENTITDYTLKADLEWFASNALTVKAGFESTRFLFTYKQSFSQTSNTSSDPSAPATTQTVESVLNINDWTHAVYGQFNYQISDDFSVQGGLRAFYLLNNDALYFDPRLSARWQMNENISLKAAWGIYHQYLRLASNPNFTFFDTWLPTDNSVGAGRATHYIVSLETKPFEGYGLNFDVYYKQLNGLNEINTFNTRSVRVSDIFFFGNGFSYGAEVFLEKKVGDLTGWVGYAYGYVGARFDSIAGGAEYNPRYDRRHDFKVVGLYKLNETWEFGASFFFQSGQPFTGRSSRFQTFLPDEQRGRGVTIPTTFNGQRLPPSHQLNLNVNYSTTLFGLPARLLIDIYNVYSRRDILARIYDTSGPTVQVRDITLLPILPTVSIEVKF
jgi:hypothetical protein